MIRLSLSRILLLIQYSRSKCQTLPGTRNTFFLRGFNAYRTNLHDRKKADTRIYRLKKTLFRNDTYSKCNMHFRVRSLIINKIFPSDSIENIFPAIRSEGGTITAHSKRL